MWSMNIVKNKIMYLQIFIYMCIYSLIIWIYKFEKGSKVTAMLVMTTPERKFQRYFEEWQ